MRDRDLPEQGARRLGLLLEQALPHGVHRHARECVVHGRDEAHDFYGLLAEDVEGPSAVLATAPGEKRLLATAHIPTVADGDRVAVTPDGRRAFSLQRKP